MRKYFIQLTVLFTVVFVFFSCSNSGKIPEKAMQLMEKAGYKTSDFLKGPYSRLCVENKELAYYYLKTKLNSPGLQLSLHEVKAGENFWGIAKENGVDIDTVVAANPDLTKLLAYTGQLLLVPNEKGVIHEVSEARDFPCLAGLYNKKVEEIKKANPKVKLKKGAVFFIPGASPKVLNPEMAAHYDKRALFRSPICGNGYSSLVGMRKHPIQMGVTKFHNGVDIRAKTGTWVGAAAEGTVIHAGWINGYGKTIKIKHENGFVTMYAHLSEIHVKNGQKVPSGKLVGKSGSTGHSTGPHLHFSVFKDGKTMNPLDYIW